ncbi:MAG: hypothetical protein ACRDQB_10440 [Thermocrispum sp.]
MTTAQPDPRRRLRLMPVAVGSFTGGVLGVLVILGLFLAGQTELPWWLSVAAVVLTSVGFALGLVGLLCEARGRP